MPDKARFAARRRTAEEVGERRVVATHDRAAVLEKVHGAAAADDVFRGFKTHGAPARDPDRKIGLRVDRGAKPIGVFGAPQGEGVFLEAFDGKHAGFGPGRKHQHVVGFDEDLERRKVFDRHALFLAVDEEHFVTLAHVDPLNAAQRCGARCKEGRALDLVAHVVGKGAVCKGNALAALEEHDIGRRGHEALQARGGADAGGHAAHDHDSHGFLRVKYEFVGCEALYGATLGLGAVKTTPPCPFVGRQNGR